MMDGLNRITGAFVDGVNGLLGAASPAVVLLFHALLLAVLVVAVYALVSNQRTIKVTRNRMIARLLEIRLFGDDPISVLASFGRVVVATGAYLVSSLKPLFFILPIAVLWIGQLAGWFEWRPIATGESAVVTMKLREEISPVAGPASLQVPAEFVVETPAFRSLDSNEIAWRVKAVRAGRGIMKCSAGNPMVEKEITAGDSLARVSPKRVGDGFWDRVLWPGEKALADQSGISEVRVDYPRRSLRFFGFEINWLIALTVASILFALVVKRPFGVEF